MSTNLAYYEEDVIRLYIDEGKSAEDTIKCLNEQHGTAFTYVWRFYKKRETDQVEVYGSSRASLTASRI